MKEDRTSRLGKDDIRKLLFDLAVPAIIIISIILTVIFFVFGEKLLIIFGASTKTILYSLNFLNIYIFGTVFVQISLGLNPFISTQGFSKISMLSTVIGAVISIILDPIFIFAFHMGVKGVALANIIAQAVSAMWILRFLFGNKIRLKIRKKNIKIKKSVIIPIIFLGISPFIMQSTESLLNIAFNSSLQKYGRDVSVGAMTILSSIMQFMMAVIMGLTQGAQPIISYNYGAQNSERIKKAFKLLITCSLVFAILYCLLIMIFPEEVISLFTNDSKLLKNTIWSLRIYMSFAFIISIQTSCQQTFIALGQAKCSVLLALLRKIILLIPLIYILPKFFQSKVFGVFVAEPISDFIATTITLITFITQLNKILKFNHLYNEGESL